MIRIANKPKGFLLYSDEIANIAAVNAVAATFKEPSKILGSKNDSYKDHYNSNLDVNLKNRNSC